MHGVMTGQVGRVSRYAQSGFLLTLDILEADVTAGIKHLQSVDGNLELLLESNAGPFLSQYRRLGSSPPSAFGVSE
jgi:hypothetical protein